MFRALADRGAYFKERGLLGINHGEVRRSAHGVPPHELSQLCDELQVQLFEEESAPQFRIQLEYFRERNVRMWQANIIAFFISVHTSLCLITCVT